MFGILLIDKHQGITSHDAIYALRKRFQMKRIGHAGTLDPLGTGLLVVALGPATRFLQYLALEPKEYRCTIRFGESTDTQDSEGAIVSKRPVPSDLGQKLEVAVVSYLGMIEQLPPMYSAVKKDGKPLYAYARQGIEVARRSRNVHIDSIELLEVRVDDADVCVVCSGGTYIRTLANDLGETIGCGAHLTALRRTRAGRFTIDRARLLENVDASFLIPLSEALAPMPMLNLDERSATAFRQGRRIEVEDSGAPGFVGVIDDAGGLIGVGRVTEEGLQPECVLPTGAPHDS